MVSDEIKEDIVRVKEEVEIIRQRLDEQDKVGITKRGKISNF